MGSSFTRHRGRGFWARDAALELWLYLLAQQVRSLDAPADWLRTAAEDWHLQATAGFTGCVSAGLDEHAATPECVATILPLAERVLSRLRDAGAVLSAEWLNSLGLGGPDSTFSRDVPTEVLARVGEAFVRLLRGEIEWDAATSPLV